MMSTSDVVGSNDEPSYSGSCATVQRKCNELVKSNFCELFFALMRPERPSFEWRFAPSSAPFRAAPHGFHERNVRFQAVKDLVELDLPGHPVGCHGAQFRPGGKPAKAVLHGCWASKTHIRMVFLIVFPSFFIVSPSFLIIFCSIFSSCFTMFQVRRGRRAGFHTG